MRLIKDPRVLEAYSFDASLVKIVPKAVAIPESIDEVCEIVEYAAEEKIPVIPRGAGTGLVGGAVGKGIIIDLRKLEKTEINEKTVVVEPGVPLRRLNFLLSRTERMFPVIPSSERACTIGGMIATDAKGLWAHKYGSTGDWVEKIWMVDGEGKIRQVGPEVCGSEGTLGVFVRAELKHSEMVGEKSVDLVEGPVEKLVDRVVEEKDNALLLEIICSSLARSLGLGKGPVLIIGYEDNSGKIRGPEAERIISLRKGLAPLIYSQGAWILEDPLIPLENLPEFLRWLEEKQIPYFSHAGIGIVHPCFSLSTHKLVPKMYELVLELDGKVSGEHGIGLRKKAFLPKNEREKWEKLKKKFDPEGIMNPGKIAGEETEFETITPEDCVLCGLCSECPVRRVIGEHGSPRAKLLLKGISVYYCTLCGLCEKICPAGVKVTEKIRMLREICVKLGTVPDGARKMIENVRKFGNPMGKEKEAWYCC